MVNREKSQKTWYKHLELFVQLLIYKNYFFLKTTKKQRKIMISIHNQNRTI